MSEHPSESGIYVVEYIPKWAPDKVEVKVLEIDLSGSYKCYYHLGSEIDHDLKDITIVRLKKLDPVGYLNS